MVAVPDQLMWELVRNNHSFMKKVNGRTKRSGCVQFSVEKGNLRSLNTFKCSGIVNPKTVDIRATADAGAVLTLKTKKAGTNPDKGAADVAIDKHFRKTEKSIKNIVVNSYYRPDLKDDALAKYTCVHNANRRVKGTMKKNVVAKGRKSWRSMKH